MDMTVIWVNHNSMQFINKVLESLDSIAVQRRVDFELIVVDDGSIDGSDKVIRDYLKNLRNSIPSIKFVKLSSSYGFTGAVNAGYKFRDRSSRYVVLCNNDACMHEDALYTYLRALESDSGIGALQGIVVNGYDRSIVDSAGGYLVLYVPSTYVEIVHFRNVSLETLMRIVSKYRDDVGLPISFFEGTLPAISIEAVKASFGSYGLERLFITAAKFYYLEDVLVSLKLWNSGFRVYLVPIVVAHHYRSLTLKHKSSSQEFKHVVTRNYSALRRIIVEHVFGKKSIVLDTVFTLRSLLKSLKNADLKYFYSVVEGFRFAKELEKVVSFSHNHRVPIVIKVSMK